jgi:ubiquinone/menaquinone biosynthesis C-methylase UbiE
MAENELLKDEVRDFWNEKSCGEVYARGSDLREQLAEQAAERFRLEPVIFEFAEFQNATGKDVLEIGVGMGADHLEWAKAGPRSLTGIDLTPRAIGFTAERLAAHGLRSDLRVGDAEYLPFGNEQFDIVYSYGVLHHSPDTAQAISEVKRVLRPGGTAKVMIYHSPSVVGWMLWARYALLAGRPGRSLREIYAGHLESPGTKAFSVAEAREMFGGFSRVECQVILGPGDLLEGAVGQRHGGVALSLAKALWPRWFIRRVLKGYGLGMLIRAVK